MNQTLSAIVIFVGIIYLFSFFTIDTIANREYLLKPYNGYIVTNKNDSFWFPNEMTLRKDTLTYRFMSEDIIFNKYEIGDTINIK